MNLFIIFVYGLSITTLVKSQDSYNKQHIGCYGIAYGSEKGLVIKMQPFEFQACLDFCSVKGTMYAGVEVRKNRCYCGNYLVENSQPFPQTSCPDFCSGFYQCGGRRTMSVFKIKDDPTTNTKETTYFLMTDSKKNWHDAFMDCRNRGMELASTRNEEEYNKLVSQIMATEKDKRSGDYWLSATDLTEENKYVWMTTGQKVEYFNWYQGEPNKGVRDGEMEHCMELQEIVGYKMNDFFCSTQKKYVCEKRTQISENKRYFTAVDIQGANYLSRRTYSSESSEEESRHASDCDDCPDEADSKDSKSSMYL